MDPYLTEDYASREQGCYQCGLRHRINMGHWICALCWQANAQDKKACDHCGSETTRLGKSEARNRYDYLKKLSVNFEFEEQWGCPLQMSEWHYL